MPHFTVMIGSDGPTIDLAVAVARAWQRQDCGSGDLRTVSKHGPGLDRYRVRPLGRSPAVPATARRAGDRLGPGPPARCGRRVPPRYDVRHRALNRRRQSRHALDFDTGGRRGPIHADGPGIDRPGCAGALHAVLQRAAGRADSLLLSRAIAPDLADRGRRDADGSKQIPLKKGRADVSSVEFAFHTEKRCGSRPDPAGVDGAVLRPRSRGLWRRGAA